MDEEGPMRCDGRLHSAGFLPQIVCCPIILLRKNCVSKLMVKHYEKGNEVDETNQTLVTLSTRVFIISCRKEIWEWEKDCNKKN